MLLGGFGDFFFQNGFVPLHANPGRILINVRRVLFLEEGKATAISDVVKQYNL